MKPKLTPDEMIAEFNKSHFIPPKRVKFTPEQAKSFIKQLHTKRYKWYQLPTLFMLIIDIICLFLIPPLIVILLLKLLGLI